MFLMIKRRAHGPPRSVQAAIQEPLLDDRQQMVSRDAEEDMGLGAAFEVMEDGPLGQRTVHRQGGRLDPRQQDLGASDFI
ncbi:MAG: hypothetical protein ACRD18_14055 [Terriglobia bacterium]